MSSQLNDTFITLVRVAQENGPICETLIKISALPHQRRLIALEKLKDSMLSQSAPQDFIDALLYLSDDDIASVLHDELIQFVED